MCSNSLLPKNNFKWGLRCNMSISVKMWNCVRFQHVIPMRNQIQNYGQERSPRCSKLAHLSHKTQLKWRYSDMKIVVLHVGTESSLVGSYWCWEKLAATNFAIDSNPENGICLQGYMASQTRILTAIPWSPQNLHKNNVEQEVLWRTHITHFPSVSLAVLKINNNYSETWKVISESQVTCHN